MSDMIYCYPGTDVLKNRLSIRNQEELDQAEREVTLLVLTDMEKNPVCGNFDVEHFKRIHNELFYRLYNWAGEFRTLDIAKGNMFCNVRFLEDYGADIFRSLKKDQFLIGMSYEKVMQKLAQYMGDINAWHPFREGNGRATRQFIGDLARATGFVLDYSMAGKDEMMQASISSFSCNYKGFEEIFRKIARPMTLEQQREFLEKVSESGLRIFDSMQKENRIPDRNKTLDIVIDSAEKNVVNSRETERGKTTKQKTK